MQLFTLMIVLLPETVDQFILNVNFSTIDAAISNCCQRRLEALAAELLWNAPGPVPASTLLPCVLSTSSCNGSPVSETAHATHACDPMGQNV